MSVPDRSAFMPGQSDDWRVEANPSLPAHEPPTPYPGLEVGKVGKVESQMDVADHLAKDWGEGLRYVHPRIQGPRFDPSPFMEWPDDEQGWVRAPTIRSKVLRFTSERLTTLAPQRQRDGTWQYVDKPLKKEGGSSEFATGCMKLLSERAPVGTWAGEWDAEPHILAIGPTRYIDLLKGTVETCTGRPLRRRRVACEPDPRWREGRLLHYLSWRLPDEAVRERQCIEWAGACFGLRLSKRWCFGVGPSGGWKTSFLDVHRRAMGNGHPFSYGGKLPSAYLVAGTRTTEHKLDSALAELQGCRVAYFDETPLTKEGAHGQWSSAFIGDAASAMDGISFRRLGKDAGVAHGVTGIGVCNTLPALPEVEEVVGAILSRLLLIPWSQTGADPKERAFLASPEATAQMLGLITEYGPLAASMPDDAPVPVACKQALVRYAVSDA